MCNCMHVFDCASVLELLHVSAFAHKPRLHFCGRVCVWVNQIQGNGDTCIPHGSVSPFFGYELWADDPPWTQRYSKDWYNQPHPLLS